MTENTADKSEKKGARRQNGQFAAGHAGGPGRPRGSKKRSALLANAAKFEEILEQEGEAVVRAVVEAAQSGDIAAARLVLDRIAPPRKGRAVEIDLPPVETVEDLHTAYGAVMEAVAAGEVTPEQGKEVADLLEMRRRTFETLDQEERLKRLEEAQAGG